LLEARRASELAALVQTYGGVPRHAPALREEPSQDPMATAAFVDRLVADPPTLVVFQTGVGARALFAAVDEIGRSGELRALLAAATVAVRGPKPTAVLRELDVRVDRRAAEPYTTAELLDTIADVQIADRAVAVQHYGEPNAELVASLRSRGARVVEAEPYHWSLPADLAPLEALLRDLPNGGVDAVVVTSQVQVRHLFQVAERLGLRADLPAVLAARTVVAAVGPVAARALRDHGVRVDLEPSHPKMGPLVRELASHFERT
jgi:uroporphyrinogen-III synthase